jgi:hypothetical protein
MIMSPLNETTNTLLLLAEASMRRLPACLPAPRGCADVEGASSVDGCTGMLLAGARSPEGDVGPPRPSSRLSIDETSSRSTSPSEAAGVPGRTFQCLRCRREYASTDAVRKHARQNHGEWLREQGQGSPALYCKSLDSPVTATENAPKRPPSALALSTPPSVGVPSLFGPDDHSALFTATESLFALCKAAAEPSGETEADQSPTNELPEERMQWAPMPVPRAGQKRPRSVRCGRCNGCMRDDCGTCKNCVDKPKFGGLGQRKQGCVKKVCNAPRVAG